MRILYFKVILESDVVFSEFSATTGGHTCLGYLPGNAFLGVCASRLYDSLGEYSFAAFHSGRVRFGNAYPIDADGNPTYPIPLAWYRTKGESISSCGKLIPENIRNLISSTDAMSSRLEQIREGFFSESGNAVFSERFSTYRMKTAIDREMGGRAEEAQLFGYESLTAGTEWLYSIEFDDDVPTEIEDSIRNELTDLKTRIGKSRTAEYGCIQITSQEPGISDRLENPVLFGNQLVFYCQSDLALRNLESGVPTFEPDATHFAIENYKAQFKPAKSFIRTRAYSPFNGKRRANDLERHVIQMGSVIVFETERALSENDLLDIQNKVGSGVGMYRYDGLGCILVNPWLLCSERFLPLTSTAIQQKVQPNSSEYKSELTNWLTEKYTFSEVDRVVIETVDKWVSTLVQEIGKLGNKAPGKSQWSQLVSISLNVENEEDIQTRLFGEDGLCSSGVSSAQWNTEFWLNDERNSFEQFLRGVVDGDLMAILGKCEELRDFELDSPEIRVNAIRRALSLIGIRLPQRLTQEAT